MNVDVAEHLVARAVALNRLEVRRVDAPQPEQHADLHAEREIGGSVVDAHAGDVVGIGLEIKRISGSTVPGSAAGASQMAGLYHVTGRPCACK